MEGDEIQTMFLFFPFELNHNDKFSLVITYNFYLSKLNQVKPDDDFQNFNTTINY